MSHSQHLVFRSSRLKFKATRPFKLIDGALVIKLNNSVKVFLKLALVGALIASLPACIILRNSISAKSDPEVLEQVRSSLSSIIPVVQPTSMALWWISRDGYSIINDYSPGVEAQLTGCIDDTLAQPMWKEFADNTVASVDKVMAANGFVIDAETNSSTSITDTKFYDYIKAYSRGKTKAVLSISPDCGSSSQETDPVMYYSASFGYTTEYEKNYDAQSPFLYDLELKDSIVHIEKSDGAFRVLSINFRRTGHAMIVKKIDEKWTELWAGQDVISCAVRDNKQIPLSISPDCI